MITVGQEFILKTPAVKKLNKQPDGRFTVSYINDRVMSVNSYGGVESRPEGTAGPQECATKIGNNLVFGLTGDNGPWAYWFPLGDVEMPF